MAGGTRSCAADSETNGSMTVGRRGFIGAGLATAGAAVFAQRATAATPAAPARELNLSPPIVDPTTQSLVRIPDGRAEAAVRHLDEIIRETQRRTGQRPDGVSPGVGIEVAVGDCGCPDRRPQADSVDRPDPRSPA